MNAIQVAEKVEKPPLTELFTDVYNDMPSNLEEQERSLIETVRKHPQDFPHWLCCVKLNTSFIGINNLNLIGLHQVTLPCFTYSRGICRIKWQSLEFGCIRISTHHVIKLNAKLLCNLDLISWNKLSIQTFSPLDIP